MSTKFKLIYLPGLGANGEKHPNRKVIRSSLALPLMRLCEAQGWDYATPFEWDRATDIPDAADSLHEQMEYAEDKGEQVLVVASSFGGWAILKTLLDQGWYPNLAGVVLLEPFFSLEGFTGKLPPLVQDGLTAFATRFGFSNFNFGKKHYWVPAPMIRSLLDPQNNVLTDGLYALPKGKVVFLDTKVGRSAFKAESDNGRLLKLLGIQPTAVTDAVPYIGGWMKRIERMARPQSGGEG